MNNTELMLSGFLGDLKETLADQNRTVLGKVKEVSEKVDSLDTRLKDVEKNNEWLMNEQPVSRRQSGRIRRAIARRVCELLSVPVNKSERSTQDQVKYLKYSKPLFGKCYAEIPNEGNLARSSYLDTPTGKFEDAMKDIDVYVPSCGMAEFYAEVDRNAVAKKIAQEQGY